MVVDDNALSLELVEDIVVFKGHHVITTSDSSKVLTFIKVSDEYPSACRLPVLLLRTYSTLTKMRLMTYLYTERWTRRLLLSPRFLSLKRLGVLQI